MNTEQLIDWTSLSMTSESQTFLPVNLKLLVSCFSFLELLLYKKGVCKEKRTVIEVWRAHRLQSKGFV